MLWLVPTCEPLGSTSPVSGRPLDSESCRDIIEACFPHLAVRSDAFLAEGWSNTVWEVNESLLFRFPKRSDVLPGLAKETGLLPFLGAVLPLAVPDFRHFVAGRERFHRRLRRLPQDPGHGADAARPGPSLGPGHAAVGRVPIGSVRSLLAGVGDRRFAVALCHQVLFGLDTRLDDHVKGAWHPCAPRGRFE